MSLYMYFIIITSLYMYALGLIISLDLRNAFLKGGWLFLQSTH